jgi:hypothetical protein
MTKLHLHEVKQITYREHAASMTPCSVKAWPKPDNVFGKAKLTSCHLSSHKKFNTKFDQCKRNVQCLELWDSSISKVTDYGMDGKGKVVPVLN